MKKFYEMPVVEITEFDSESIMTASVDTLENTATLKTTVEGFMPSTTNSIVKVEAAASGSVYNW